MTPTKTIHLNNAGLGRGGLHFNSKGLSKLATNSIKKIENFNRPLQLVSSLQKNFFDCDLYQNSEISCPES